MSMKQPLICEIAKDTFLINEYGFDCMFFLKGKERGLLIDTGTGTFDLKGMIDSFCSLPYDVLLTHGHVDHAGGIDQFDKIMIHPADIEMVKNLTYEERYGYAEALHSMDTDHAFAFSMDQVRRWDRIPEFIPVQEGTMDLGGRPLRIYHTPGHTPGSIVILDEINRILISADACNRNTLCVSGCTVETLLNSALKIQSLKPYFDRDYNGHVGYAGMPYICSQYEGVHEDVIAACRSVMDQTAQVTDEQFHGRAVCAVTSGNARIVFDPELIYNR